MMKKFTNNKYSKLIVLGLLFCLLVIVFINTSYTGEIVKKGDFVDNPLFYLNRVKEPETTPIFSLFDLTQISLVGFHKYTDPIDTNNVAIVIEIDHIRTKAPIDFIIIFDRKDGDEYYSIRDGAVRNFQTFYGHDKTKKIFIYFPNDVTAVGFHNKIKIQSVDYDKFIKNLLPK